MDEETCVSECNAKFSCISACFSSSRPALDVGSLSPSLAQGSGILVAAASHSIPDDSCDGMITLPLWASLLLSGSLVLLSALFSGLTLGLMSLDKMTLRVLAEGGTSEERRYAKAIIPLREHSNLLLCTLLFGNTVVNAFLSILLAELSSGWIGLATSSLLIVSCGEILPQSLCSKHGLRIGSALAPVVSVVTVILFPLAWPVSKVLDFIFGEDIGNVYNIQKLKRLIAIHAEAPEAQQVSELTPQDKKFLMGALEYRNKSVSDVMTDINQTYCLDIGEKLDFQLMVDIYKCGFTRIPVYEEHRGNIIGILFVKDLILLDPEDEIELKSLLSFHGKGVDFVDECTPLGEVFKMFIKGLSHIMVAYRKDDDDAAADTCGGAEATDAKNLLKRGDAESGATTIGAASAYEVSKFSKGSVTGIITLEDVLEEVLQTEIVDETDQYESNACDRRIARKGQGRFRQNLSAFFDVVNPKQWKEERISVQEMKAILSFLCMNVVEFRRLAMDTDGLVAPDGVASDVVLESLIRRSTIIELHDEEDQDVSVLFASPANVDTSLKTKLQTNGEGKDAANTHPLYRMGKPANAFTLILSGKVVVRAGAEGFESELGPWSYLGARAITGPAYVPDFSAHAIRPFRVLQVSRSDFMAANRAKLVKKKSLAKSAARGRTTSDRGTRVAPFKARAQAQTDGATAAGRMAFTDDTAPTNSARARMHASSAHDDAECITRGYNSTGSIEIRIDDSDDDHQHSHARVSRHNSDGNDRFLGDASQREHQSDDSFL